MISQEQYLILHNLERLELIDQFLKELKEDLVIPYQYPDIVNEDF